MTLQRTMSFLYLSVMHTNPLTMPHDLIRWVVQCDIIHIPIFSHLSHDVIQYDMIIIPILSQCLMVWYGKWYIMISCRSFHIVSWSDTVSDTLYHAYPHNASWSDTVSDTLYHAYPHNASWSDTVSDTLYHAYPHNASWSDTVSDTLYHAYPHNASWSDTVSDTLWCYIYPITLSHSLILWVIQCEIMPILTQCLTIW